MSSLLVSVSGVRGIVGETFTEEMVASWAGAFAKLIGGWHKTGGTRIVLGRDTRTSGEWAINVAANALGEHGVPPLGVGVVPTPTVQLAVTHHRAAGGLIITASHNPTEWNGLKFVGPDGVFLSAEEMKQLHESVVRSERARPQDPSGRVRVAPKEGRIEDTRAIARHVDNILALPIDHDRIRARKFRVVLDPVNGTGAFAVPPLLEQLGCSVIMLNGEPNGEFAHPPEPTPANLKDLGDRVRAEHADLGIAVDPDADRLVLVNEKGEVLNEEYTVTLAALSALHAAVMLRDLPAGRRGAKNLAQRDSSSRSDGTQDDQWTVVVNLSTTRMVEDVARMFGAQVTRTAIGERHVVEGMRKHRALIGGEGNGGVIYSKSHEGRDALVGIALILDLLSRENVSLDQLTSRIPTYVMKKEKLPRGTAFDPTRFATQIAHSLLDATVSTIDGVRVDAADGWVHVRPSNTEPIVRLIAETVSEATLKKLMATARTALDVAG